MTTATREAIEAIATKRLQLISTLSTRPSGLAWCSRHTELADEVVTLFCDDLAENLPDLPAIAVIATGGYGRNELSPHSDIDITVVPVDESSPITDRAVRQLFQDMHWAFGTALRLSVGYAYRLISDAPGLDAKTRTGLLDMRLLWGSFDLFRELEQALIDSFSAGEFILAKIREREAMLAKHHDTPLVVEPHLKEGAGGLRCFHCANWLRESIGEQSARPSEAYNTVVRYRNQLHAVSGRYQDLFTRAKQAEVADRLGLGVYDMMSDLAEAASELHGEYLRVKERLCESRYPLAPGVLAVMGEARVVGRADAGEAAVGIAFATQLGLKVSDIPVVPANTVQGPAAIFAVKAGEPTLRNLDRCGLLEFLLPELSRCRTLMPQDTVHTYTVFEHTLRVIRNLDSIESGTFLGEVMGELKDIEALYLAALLHDVGKADHERPHSETGADIARDVSRRWALNEGTAADVEWLVAHHLDMDRFIRIRDTQDPKTIAEFAEMVGNVDRLRMLTVLTWADVNAVAAGAWTPAQDTFLKDLYHRCYAALHGDGPKVPDASQTRQRLMRQLKGHESEEEVQLFVASLPVHYMSSTPVEVVRLHMKFVRQAVHGKPTVELYQRADIGASEVTVCALDEPGLLSKLLGVFYAYDLSVMGIRASTTTTNPAVALDVFTLAFNGRPVPTATYNQVSLRIEQILRKEQDVSTVLREKGKDPDRKQQLFRYLFHAGTPGILEVRAPRGRGMPYRFSRLLAENGWNILGARVGQWAGNGAASFTIVGRDGQPVTAAEVEQALQPLAAG